MPKSEPSASDFTDDQIALLESLHRQLDDQRTDYRSRSGSVRLRASIAISVATFLSAGVLAAAGDRSAVLLAALACALATVVLAIIAISPRSGEEIDVVEFMNANWGESRGEALANLLHRRASILKQDDLELSRRGRLLRAAFSLVLLATVLFTLDAIGLEICLTA